MRKWVKILLFAIAALLLVLVIGVAYLYYHFEGKYDVDESKYPHHVGYLSSDNRDFSKNFKRCSDGLPIGFYSSPA